MKPDLRRELFNRYKEVRCKRLFRDFVSCMEKGWVYAQLDDVGEAGFYPDYPVNQVTDTIRLDSFKYSEQ